MEEQYWVVGVERHRGEQRAEAVLCRGCSECFS
jgi:hypothetical protein